MTASRENPLCNSKQYSYPTAFPAALLVTFVQYLKTSNLGVLIRGFMCHYLQHLKSSCLYVSLCEAPKVVMSSCLSKGLMCHFVQYLNYHHPRVFLSDLMCHFVQHFNSRLFLSFHLPYVSLYTVLRIVMSPSLQRPHVPLCTALICKTKWHWH